jgi:hypothetical protein
LNLVLQYSSPEQLESHERFLNSPELSLLPPPLHPPVSYQEEAWRRTLEALPAGHHREVERIWIGNEFCSYLEWSRAEVEMAADLLRCTGIAGSLVLGPVLPERWDEALEIVEIFALKVPEAEFVVNDWGAAAELSGRGYKVELGRLLFRAKRLPRFSMRMIEPAQVEGVDIRELQTAQAVELATDPLAWAPHREMMESLGISRYTVELTPQGFRPFVTEGVARTLSLPWAYVTGGGRCPLFEGDGSGGCRRACRGEEIMLRYESPTWPVIQLGMSVFMLAVGVAGGFLKQSCWDRLLVQPWVPI